MARASRRLCLCEAPLPQLAYARALVAAQRSFAEGGMATPQLAYPKPARRLRLGSARLNCYLVKRR
jgi:hypothetical protein